MDAGSRAPAPEALPRIAARPALLQAAALGALVVVFLVQPAVRPEQAWAADLALVAAALLVTASAGAAPLVAGAGVAVAAAGLAASHAAAPDAAASWSALAAWARLALAATAGAALAASPALPRRLALAWGVLGCAFAVHAALQVAWLEPAALATLPADAGGGFIAQLSDGRGNSVFLLPAHLAAFLAAAAVLSASVAVAAPRRGLAVAAVLLAVACGAGGLLLAGSFGGALLLALGLAALALRVRGRAGVALLAAGVVAVAVVLGVSWTRRSEAVSVENPGTARTANWVSAAVLVRERPVLGHGGGSFAAQSQRVKPAWANDARHAHQAFLEAAAEHGAWTLPLLAALVAATAGIAVRRSGDATAAGVGAAALVALGHGFLDFGWSDPAWAVPAAVVVGATWGARRPAEARPRLAAAAVVAALSALVLSDSATAARLVALDRRALALAAEGRHAEAHAAYVRAAYFDPASSEAAAGAASARLAEALSSQGGDRDARLDEAASWARRAVELSPHRAIHHDLLAAVEAARGRRLQALAAAARAAQLAPHVESFRARRDAVLASLEAVP